MEIYLKVLNYSLPCFCSGHIPEHGFLLPGFEQAFLVISFFSLNHTPLSLNGLRHNPVYL